MCDTLCAIGTGRALFGKNSDRPPPEVQVVEAFGRREAGGRLNTQYLTLDDPGAVSVLGSRPDWLWGFEHGVNEHRVAIGNEKVYTVDDPYAAEPALIGMDLVRLGLERSENADDALAIITQLLEHYGQGGVGEATGDEPYFSSFLIADPSGGWVLETSGRTWAARPVEESAAISNRITIGRDWTRASADIEPGTDFDRLRNKHAPTGHADVRLDASRSCLAVGATLLGPRDVVAHLRHHGERPWGAPGDDPADLSPLPKQALPDGSGVTVCMHVRGFQNTTSSIVTELPEDPAEPLRGWVALGSPCTSVYVPVFPPGGIPAELSDPEVWHRFAGLRDRVESDDDALGEVRAVLVPVEAELWAQADKAAGDPAAEEAFVASAWGPVQDALERLSRGA